MVRWRWHRAAPVVCVCLVASQFALPSFAAQEKADAVTESPQPVLTKAMITAQIEKLQADEDLDAATKKDAVDLLKTALDDLERSLDAEQRKLRLQRQRETATRELDALRQKLAVMPSKATTTLPQDADAELIERHRDELERSLDQSETGLRERVTRLQTEQSERPSRLESLIEELAETEEKLDSLRTGWKELPEDDDSELAAPNRLAVQVAIQRAEQEVAALEAEREWLESSDAERWIDALIQIAERDVARVEDELRQVEDRLEQQRSQEAQNRLEQARQESRSIHPALKTWTAENELLAERSRQLTDRIKEIEDELDQVNEQLESLETEFDELRKMVSDVGRNDAIGLMLRQQASRLPSRRTLRRELADREDEARDIKLKRFEIDRQRKSTPTAEALVQQANSVADRETIDIEPAALQLQAETVLEHRDNLLDQLDGDYKRLNAVLLNLAGRQHELLKRTQTTAQFYEEQRMWVRTGSVFGLIDLKQMAPAARWLSNPQGWSSLPEIYLEDMTRRPVIYLVAAVTLCAVLFWTGRRRSEAIDHQEFSFAATVTEATSAALRAGLIPAGLAFLAWRLDQTPASSDWLPGISHGLWRCAAWVWPLILLRNTSGAEGLAIRQLGWTPDAARQIRRQATWLLVPSTFLMFLVGATESAKSEVVTDSLGRAAFLLLMIMTAAFCRGILSTQAEVWLTASQSPWKKRWTMWLSWLIPLAPCGLAVIAFAGYYDTALRLAWRLEATAWCWLILAGLKSAGARWIAGEQQRLQQVPDPTASASVVDVRSPEKKKSLFARIRDGQAARGPSPAQVGQQMLTLLETAMVVAALCGLTTIWKDVLPAADWLDRWTLWQTVATHQVVESLPNGGAEVRNVSRMDPVTAIDVGLALIICGITIVAARNVPGLVEVLFLERLTLDLGSRFAVTILVRYALFVIGVSLACSRMNIGWSNVQWLVAAASVGLGFGLQDIFANFVSGIILLFERPIRVGDVITIGDTTGTVNQIRFRSTTIVDADRKELVVPNKDLITGKLLNWTLSDHTNRIKIRVAVSYDSDPNRVKQLLQEIAFAHPTVLKDPPPTATLEEFGPNTLVFVLKAFLPSLDDRSKVNHELHSTIHDRLQAAGIGTPASPTPTPAPPPKNAAA